MFVMNVFEVHSLDCRKSSEEAVLLPGDYDIGVRRGLTTTWIRVGSDSWIQDGQNQLFTWYLYIVVRSGKSKCTHGVRSHKRRTLSYLGTISRLLITRTFLYGVRLQSYVSPS